MSTSADDAPAGRRPQGRNINPRKQLRRYRLWIRLTTLLITSEDVYPGPQPVNGLHEVLRLLMRTNSSFITSWNWILPGERNWLGFPRRLPLTREPSLELPRDRLVRCPLLLALGSARTQDAEAQAQGMPCSLGSFPWPLCTGQLHGTEQGGQGHSLCQGPEVLVSAHCLPGWAHRALGLSRREEA